MHFCKFSVARSRGVHTTRSRSAQYQSYEPLLRLLRTSDRNRSFTYNTTYYADDWWFDKFLSEGDRETKSQLLLLEEQLGYPENKTLAHSTGTASTFILDVKFTCFNEYSYIFMELTLIWSEKDTAATCVCASYNNAVDFCFVEFRNIT